MSSVSTKASAPSPLGTAIASFMGIRKLAEVLHEPRGPDERVGQCRTRQQVEFDGTDRDLGRGVFHSVGAQVGDMADPGALGLVEELGDDRGVVRAHDG
jgi:hypothetical protein